MENAARIISTVAVVLIALVAVMDYLDRKKIYNSMLDTGAKKCTCKDKIPPQTGAPDQQSPNNPL